MQCGDQPLDKRKRSGKNVWRAKRDFMLCQLPVEQKKLFGAVDHGGCRKLPGTGTARFVYADLTLFISAILSRTVYIALLAHPQLASAMAGKFVGRGGTNSCRICLRKRQHWADPPRELMPDPRQTVLFELSC